ncbi:AMP-binding protein [Micromonospora sp. NPDC005220]|uniref:AMP-binding protein n=1 Tax=Micromonospora sp. NPDC005220 TaxID=3155589 RepID=UPI0033A0A2A7
MRQSLWDMLATGQPRRSLHTWADGGYVETPWHVVIARAHTAASVLSTLGVGPGVRVAGILTNRTSSIVGLLGAWLTGAVVASLPLPSRGADPGEYPTQLAGITADLDARLLLLDDELRPLGLDRLATRVPLRSWDSLTGESGRRTEPALPRPDDECFIQFSSGSTGRPKGCVLSARSVARQIGMIRRMSASGVGRERVASWLPLSHDMGIFGCLLYSLAYDFEFFLSTPERFTLSPRSWFRDLAEHRITLTAGTSTGLHLATRAQGAGRLPRPLALRACVLGAERIDHEVLRGAVRTFGPDGLRMSHFMPAYGLAEATLAVTACPPSEPPKTMTLDAVRLADGEVVVTAPGNDRATTVVSCGRPCEGVSVSTTEPGRLSEIVVASPSLAEGYFADPVLTRERFDGGRLLTGDLGFLADGELYVVGRMDDLLSVGGRKVHARELEAAVDALGLLRQGCSVVLDLPGAPAELVLLAELRRRTDDVQRTALEAATAVRAKGGVVLARCFFVERNTLPRTPSGKIQRFRARWLLQRRRLAIVATIDVNGNRAGKVSPILIPSTRSRKGAELDDVD